MKYNTLHKIHIQKRRSSIYRRVLSLCAALLLAFSAATPAYATEDEKQITDGNTISVDISWGAMEFTYMDKHELWNPESHQYDRTVPAHWTSEDNWIMLGNTGNNGVKAEFAVEMAVNSVTGMFAETENAEHASASYTMELGKSENSKIWFEIDGKINTSYATLGTIIITIIAQ